MAEIKQSPQVAPKNRYINQLFSLTVLSKNWIVNTFYYIAIRKKYIAMW